jgi:putative flippase GtrA
VYRLLRQLLLLNVDRLRSIITHALCYMGAGFVGVPINAGVFATSTRLLSDWAAVFVACVVAGSVVFLLQDRYTFRHDKARDKSKSYCLFVTGNLTTASLNMSAVFVLQHFGASRWEAYVAGMALCVPCNYSWNRWVVFRKRTTAECAKPSIQLVERSETTSPH